MTTLDVEAVQAFLAIADQQSFTRAAKQLGTTQGAVSVKLKRLEERLGHKLIERTPRSVRLSAQGALFVDFARDFVAAHNRALAGLASGRRRFVLGIATHVAGPEVPTLLARLNAHDPTLAIEMQLDSVINLLPALDRGAVDAAIVRRDDDRRDGEVLAPEPFGWYATPDFVHPAARRCAWRRRLPPAAFATSPPGRSMPRGSRGPRSSSAAAPWSPMRSRRAWPSPPSPGGSHRRGRWRSAGSSACLRSRPPSLSCFQACPTANRGRSSRQSHRLFARRKSWTAPHSDRGRRLRTVPVLDTPMTQSGTRRKTEKDSSATAL